MKKTYASRTYFARPIRRYAYPNAAEPSYFFGKVLDAITATVTCFGTVTLLIYFLTI